MTRVLVTALAVVSLGLSSCSSGNGAPVRRDPPATRFGTPSTSPVAPTAR